MFSRCCGSICLWPITQQGSGKSVVSGHLEVWVTQKPWLKLRNGGYYKRRVSYLTLNHLYHFLLDPTQSSSHPFSHHRMLLEPCRLLDIITWYAIFASGKYAVCWEQDSHLQSHQHLVSGTRGLLWVQGWLGLCSRFQAGLGYIIGHIWKEKLYQRRYLPRESPLEGVRRSWQQATYGSPVRKLSQTFVILKKDYFCL